MQKVALSGLVAAVGNAKAGDVIVAAESGTLVFDKGQPLPFLSAPNVSLYLDGVTLREVLRPFAYGTDTARVCGMAALGLTGPGFTNLSKTDQARVTAYLDAMPPPDISASAAVINNYLATLSPVIDARMWDAKPNRLGQVTLNGKTYTFPVRWRSTVSKGLLTVKLGVWGTYVHGGIFQNARMEGSSYNAAGIRTQASSDIFVEGVTFQDCEDGLLMGGSTVVNPNGDWYADGPSDRLDFFGFNVDKDCTYDNCGSPSTGLAHGAYGNDCLYNISIRPKSIRSNGGHFRKFHGGLQICLGADFQDAADSGGVEQCVDMDGGAGYVINSTLTKNSSGNDGAPLLMRNGREPIPSSFENVLVAKGNVITYAPIHVANFVNALNEPAFVKASGATSVWPGVPLSIRTIIDGNVFRCVPGAPVSRTPVNAPAGSVVRNNQIIGLNDPIPDVRIPLPNWDWTRSSLVADVSDFVSKVDPDAKFMPWLTSKPLYPAAVSVSFTEMLAPAPTPATTPEEDPAMIAELQAQNATLTAQLATVTQQLNDETNQQAAANAALTQRVNDLTGAVATLTADRDAQAAQVASLTAQLATVTADRDAQAAALGVAQKQASDAQTALDAAKADWADMNKRLAP